MTTFRIATDKEREGLEYALRQWHKRLAQAEVRVLMLFAINDDGPAVTHGGYAAIAKIKPLPLKERITKNADAELLVDESVYVNMSHEEILAMFDHELCHIDVIANGPSLFEGGQRFKTDDIGRPKLKSVKGDWNIGDGFAAVIERHGEHALEHRNLRSGWKVADKICKEATEEPTGKDI